MGLYTIVCEFMGTTSVMQVSASGGEAAAQAWTRQLRAEALFGPSSGRVAGAVEESLLTLPPTPVAGVVKVWCLSTSCDGQLCLANIVETNPL
ncbi:hypothetical protein [Erythrobacter colymbi]|uniref:hypothetical protein n=1 Tax=Erythrobacter colymbi TaxID=1161202 RepID=UPI000A3C4DA0|nr:hypothetical protein [Erythrobacter colymbi]